jgi:hypothetical protein
MGNREMGVLLLHAPDNRIDEAMCLACTWHLLSPDLGLWDWHNQVSEHLEQRHRIPLNRHDALVLVRVRYYQDHRPPVVEDVPGQLSMEDVT